MRIGYASLLNNAAGVAGRGTIMAMAMAAAVWTGSALAQGQAPAREGRGLLAPSAELRAEGGGVPPAHVFEPDASGAFSRTIFSTDDDPDFNIRIREYSFPPDRQTHTVTLPSAAFIHLLSGSGRISVGKKPLDVSAAARSAVPAGVPIDVATDGDDPLVVRALIVEAK
jgi:quercetin dioxygenase-like cupin family protein